MEDTIVSESADELWAPIPGFADAYTVSDRGRVKSLPRTVLRGSKQYRIPGKILKNRIDDVGRQGVMLYSGGKRYGRGYFVHRLVLLAFVGPCPVGMECCHANDVPGDNRLSNLRWDTHSANGHDKVRNGGDYNANKTHCVNGHEFTPENTYAQTKGGRGCKECQRKCIREHMRRVRSKPLEKGHCRTCRQPRDSAQFKLCTPPRVVNPAPGTGLGRRGWRHE